MNTNNKDKHIGRTIIKTVIIAILAFLFILPLIWMFLSSIKTTSEVFAYPFKWLHEVP